MKIFKFGGASIKDAVSIKHLAEIVSSFNEGPLVIIISAMAKTTNALEAILEQAYNQEDYNISLKALLHYHLSIIQELFGKKGDTLTAYIEYLFASIKATLNTDLSQGNYDFIYDDIISRGEIASTKIVNDYLNLKGINSHWFDARHLIRTDSTYREGKVDWKYTCQNIKRQLDPVLKNSFVLTQGFIASDAAGNTTTLGREGSDYSAAIFGSCLNAEEVVIWKDVEGIFNADPKRLKQVIKYEELPYQEAVEMTFYGASVIHPKTIKPLANKKIPLWVRSFDNIMASGTCIHECEVKNLFPSIIFKPNQCLISFRTKDFTFINEHNLSLIFQTLDTLNIKANLMQNSAISFSICVDNQKDKISNLIHRLVDYFVILYNEALELITIKNATDQLANEISLNKQVFLEQRTRSNYQIVVSEKESTPY